MKISLGDGVEVAFPYDYIYPEQLQYMRHLKQLLDTGGHGLIEMPSGTGKTATILSFMLAYQRAFPDRIRQIIYCTRTVPEVDKALGELKRIVGYRGDSDVLGIGLSARKNLCINTDVLSSTSGGNDSGWSVDARCHALTASWRRESDSCRFFETLEANRNDNKPLIPIGIYTLEELKEYGRQSGMCPYFLARHALGQAKVLIYSYYYLLDPKVAESVSRSLTRDAVVVFDEAHNIDNVCIESLSIDLTRSTVDNAARSLNVLSDKIAQIKQEDSQRLKDEYENLLRGLKRAQSDRLQDRIMASPVLPDDLLINSTQEDESMVPGSIRRAEHFVAFMKRFVEFLRSRFRRSQCVISESPSAFLESVKRDTLIERRPMRFMTERLAALERTLQDTSTGSQHQALQRVAAFGTLVSTYQTGFTVLFEPLDETAAAGATSALLTLSCLDATIAMRPVLSRFRAVLITSGTLSPLEIYPRLLDFSPVIMESLPMTLVRDQTSPLIVTRGADQVAVSSRFEIRNDPAVVRNYGQLLVDFCRVTPDGLVAFFPSYTYLETIVSMWTEMGIMEAVMRLRLVFIETPDIRETTMALNGYRKACDLGRGGVLLSVARGKVSEGIDFDGHYGRAVILFGIPFQYTESRILKARLEYMREAYDIRETDFLSFDALRHAAQCLGRVLRGKNDYGLMVLADKRYNRPEKRNKLPKWIANNIAPANVNLSADQAVVIAKAFFRRMANPIDQRDQIGYALLREEDIE